MEQDKKIKLLNSLTFEQSDLWDGVLFMIDEAFKNEVDIAINQNIEESKRPHQAGRADGIAYIKELLESTRSEALHLSGRK
ncbi:MAG: hypothetical protein EB127_03485 [Alphaproteobacteria bacterium]|nr:hypothetical protein [Alphaproteobacteria bacterium]